MHAPPATHLLLAAGAFMLGPTAHAQALVVEPFLQSMTPTSTWVVWEIDQTATSSIAYGDAPDALDHQVDATLRPSQGDHQIVEAQITGLSPATRVYYRVRSGDTAGSTQAFVTPPEPGSDAVIRLIAMSDMQRSARWPTKFHEIVHDGIIDWAQARWGDDLAGELSMLLIPGDLVENGPVYEEWSETFFAPLQPLSASVPIWPVYGNHELGTHWFNDYFHLPENGSVAGAEHWWETRYANLLVVGLDSNEIGAWGAQMDWLDDLLADACADPTLDFVFTELHHPFQSELWTPGNNPLVSILVDKLDTFSADCGKPTVQFFGHTHAYSRGQARDARHLMVNVATAGGGIDRWGEQDQRDYEPFSVSDDTWGFVVVEVTAGTDPSLTLRRISRGDAEETLDNKEIDVLSLRVLDDPPATPRLTAPGDGVDGACVTLRGSEYSDPEGDAQQATQWQLAPTCDGLDAPTHDVWRQDRNLYFGIDSQSQDDLGDESFRGVSAGSWCTRVRYRDSSLLWSDWSAPHSFVVAAPSVTANLLPDPGAEDELKGWDTEGQVEITGDTRCGAAVPAVGARAVGLGGPCAAHAAGSISVRIPVADEEARIQGGTRARWGASVVGAGATLEMTFLDVEGGPLGTESVAAPGGTTWTRSEGDVAVPADTVAITVRVASDGGSQVDDLELSLGKAGPIDCAEVPVPVPVNEVAPDDEHCGCAHTPGGMAGAWWLAAAIAWSRRRSTRPPATHRPASSCSCAAYHCAHRRCPSAE